MDEPILVVISLTMFIGSYLAGCIPLFFSLNERRIRIASILGAGLLVGTAFCVIIPEGISSLAESSLIKTNRRQFSNSLGNIEENVQPKLAGDGWARMAVEQKGEITGKKRDVNERPNGVLGDDLRTGNDQRIRRGVNALTMSESNNERPRKEPPEEVPSGGQRKKDEQRRHVGEQNANFEQLNGVIGVSLLVGFLFMHVIDQLSKLSHSRHKGMPTLGLVIHSFADGVAMGSTSSAGSRFELQILVFVAIMLHKAPTAFALISILLANGMDKVRVRRHLLIFSLAAPIGTVLIYFFLHMIQSSTLEDPLTDAHEGAPSQFTGIVLLFSAGTFLYIATVHVLPELIEAKCSGGGGISGSREMLLGGGDKVASSASASRLSLVELCIFCASAIVPSFISSATHSGHRH